MTAWKSADERAAFLMHFFDLYRKSWVSLSSGQNSGRPQDRPAAAGPGDLLHTLALMRQEYEVRIPVLPLSRCPFTGRVAYHSIDPYGIDGLWWSYETPLRPVESLPSRYLAFSGAMKLVPPVIDTPFLCKPGPGSPFVLPRILNHESTKAVIFSLPVGNHCGFPIFYFTDTLPKASPGVTNDWGMSFWQHYEPDGTPQWMSMTENETEYDFYLDPWVQKGKLLWIAPGDRTMTLRTGLSGCPYTGLGGEENIQRVQYGNVWTS
jgi:hypothetical protein